MNRHYHWLRPIAAVLAVVVLTCLHVAPAHAAAQNGSKYAGLSAAQLEKELAQVLNRGKKLQALQSLQRAGKRIASGPCARYYGQAQRSHNGLVQLNRRYKGRADNSYREQATQARKTNASALGQYRQCFSRQIAAHDRGSAKQVVDYATFRKTFTDLAVELDGETEARLKQQAELLYAARQKAGTVSRFPVATLAGATGSVRIMRQGRQLRVSKGINLVGADEFRTGGNGRVRIDLTELVQRQRRGPFHLLIGPNTKVAIGRNANMVVQNGNTETIRLHLALSYGSIRIINSGARRNGQYTVQAGAGLVRLLGSDAIVSHYPKRALLNLKLRTGDAQIFREGRQGRAIPIGAGQQVSMRRGLLQTITRLNESQWQAAMNASGKLAQRGGARPDTRQPSAPARTVVAREDILLRAAAREAVDRMLSALRNVDTKALMASTSGIAKQNARRSMSRATLEEVLQRSGRPAGWSTDCVACQPDGACAVPTLVNLNGGPSKQYEALHIVRPATNGAYYLVNRIDPWDGAARRTFQRNKPLCEAELK